MKFAAIYLVLLVITAIDIVTAEDQSVPNGTIYGHVYDAQTKQPISGAWVYCQETKCKPVATDSSGYYAIENCFSPSRSYVIEGTKYGYQSVKNTAKTDANGKVEVDLNLEQIGHPEATVQVGPETGPSIMVLSNNTTVNVTLENVTLESISEKWDKTFGGSDLDIGYSVCQAADGGYVIAGRTWSYGAGQGDAWLIKTDANGNKLWDRILGGSEDDHCFSILQTSDGDYITAGKTSSYGAGGSDAWLIKIDTDGNKIWDRTFGERRDDDASSVQQTTDGGFIIAGSKGTYNAGADVWLIKTNADGKKLWDRNFGGSNADWGRAVQQTSDGGYIIIGGTYSYGAGDRDIWLVKTDSEGRKQWDRTFGASDADDGNSVWQTNDGGYIIAGFTCSYGSVGDIWLIKTDADGNKLWDRCFRGSDSNDIGYGYSIQQTSDNGYIITGTYGGDIWLIKTDANGNKLWDRLFGGSGSDIGQYVRQTSDGGFIITGATGSYGAGEDDVWLIKTDANGDI